MQMAAYDCFILLLIKWNWHRLFHMLYWTHTYTILFNVCHHLFHLFFILLTMSTYAHSQFHEWNKQGLFIMVRFVGFPKCFNKTRVIKKKFTAIDAKPIQHCWWLPILLFTFAIFSAISFYLNATQNYI